MRGLVRLLFCAGLGLASAGVSLADGQTPVSIEARQRNIREVIAELAKQAKVEVKIRPEVRGSITTTITRTPFEKALSVVCAAEGYNWRQVKGVYYVGRFSSSPEDSKPVTEKIPLHVFAPRVLARAFGWLDLESLDEPGGGMDLRTLLPPGLQGPPKPIAGGLEVSGTKAAVADFGFLVKQLEEGRARIRYRVIVAEVTDKLVEGLPVYWAKGAMHFGQSPGRDALYSSGDFTRIERLLAEGADGVQTVLRKSVLAVGMDTAVVANERSELHVAARVESSLQLRLWARLQVKVEAGTVEAVVDGAPLPPDEGSLLVTRPKAGEAGPTLLMLVMPSVVVPEE